MIYTITCINIPLPCPRCFFNRPLYLVRFQQMSKDKDFTENLHCTKILDDNVMKLREAFRVNG